VIEALVHVAQKFAQRVGLRQRARETVEDEAAASVAFQLLADQADDDLVGHEFAARHHVGDAFAHFGSAVLGLAQHVAGRELHHAPLLHETLCLGPLPRARRAQKYDIHRRAGPFRGFAPLFLPRSWLFDPAVPRIGGQADVTGFAAPCPSPPTR
jgi:hypothetical protein